MVAQYAKVAANGGTWRLRDERTGEFVARIWSSDLADRFVRDSQMVESLAPSLGLSAANRRTAAITQYTAWLASGGRVLDLTALSATASEGNQMLSGDQGYFHGQVYDHTRPLRYVKYAEDIWAARQITNSTQQRNATDAAVNALIAAGGLG